MATHASDHGENTAAAKSLFANLRTRFANEVIAGQVRVMAAAAAVLVVVAGISGPFGTLDLPIGERFAFWALLFSAHFALWWIWLAISFRKSDDWRWAIPVGMVIANLPLPLMIDLCLRLFGRSVGPGWPMIWLQSLAIAAAILVFITFIVRLRPVTGPTAAPARKRLLWRAGIHDTDELLAIKSEDHYCRLARREGDAILVHGRFTDFVTEASKLDGIEVRRGHWIAARAVDAIERRDGAVWITLVNGDEVRASAAGAKRMRAAGWL